MLALIFLVLSFVFGVFLLNWLDNKTSFFNLSFLVFSFGLGLAVSGYAVLVLALVLKSLFYGLVIFSIFGLVFVCLFFKKIFSILKRRSVISCYLKTTSGSKTPAVFDRLYSPQFHPAEGGNRAGSGSENLFLNNRKLLISSVFSRHNIFIFLMVAVVVILGLQSMLFDAEGLPFGVLKGWGDGAYHLNMVQRLATADPFVLDQPVAGGRVLSYPVLVNFLSAIFSFSGLPLPVAWHLPTLIFAVGLVLALFHLGKKYLNKNSLAVVFVFLVLFGAGLGYFWFFDEVQKDAGQIGWVSSFFNNFFEPKFEYSHLDTRTGGKPSEKNMPANIVWIVPAVSFFSHQRSFIVGGFLGALFLLGFMKFASFDFKYFLLLGLLPLAHTHSFLALFVLASCLIIFSGKFFEVLKNKYVWLASALALSQLAYLFYALSQNGGTKIVPWLGWMACKHSVAWFLCDPNVPGTDSSILWFWLKNFGLVFIVWIGALIINGLFTRRSLGGGGRIKKLKTKELVLPSVVLFILPNILLFQPWEFDNNKIFFWWWLLAVLLSLSLFGKEEKPRQFSIFNFQFSKIRFSIISYSLLVVFVFGSSFSGIIDTSYRLQSGVSIEKNIRNFGYYGEEETKISDWIKQNTKPNDTFLTSSSPTQFVPMLSGRPIYLGFTGWVWTQGGDAVIADRKTKINEFAYSGNTEKLCFDGVRYWLADQPFFKEYPSSESRVSAAGEVVFELGQEKILKLNCGD